MRRLLLLAVPLLLLGAILAWCWSSERPQPARHLAGPAGVGRGAAGVQALLEVVPAAAPLAADGREPVEPALAASTGPAREARLHLDLVEAGTDTPIAGALVHLYRLRCERDPGHLQPLPDAGSAQGRSDGTGGIDLWYPQTLPVSGRVIAVDVLVEHEEFQVWRNGTIAVEGLETLLCVELVRRCMLVLTGWTADREVGEVLAVEAFQLADATGSSEYRRDLWKRDALGRLYSLSLLPGDYTVAIFWSDPNGQLYQSRREALQLRAGQRTVASLELLPPLTLVGELDPQVPRPVRNGWVELHWSVANAEDRALETGTRVPIDAQGRFRCAGLPAGPLRIAAACQGWALEADQQPQESTADPVWKSLVAGEKLVLRHVGADGRPMLRKDLGRCLALPCAAPVILPMQSAADFELRVLDPEGQPAVGVEVWVGAWTRYAGQAALMVDEAQRSALTDEHGFALLENLAPGEFLGYTVRSRQLRPGGPTLGLARPIPLELRAGARTSACMSLEPVPALTPGFGH